jgi:hypothetical protein
VEIKLFFNHTIDKQEWDDFIYRSPQGSIYALSDYLNIIHPDWQGFIIEDKGEWQAIMPWFVKSIFGVKSAFQPALCQFQGAFIKASSYSGYKQIDFERKIGELFATSILENSNKYESNFSPSVQYVLPYYWKGLEIIPRFTYYLPLPSTTTDYSKNHQRALQKANKCDFKLEVSSSATEMIALFKQNKGAEIKLLNDHHYFNMEKIVEAFLPRQMAHVLSCRDANGTLVASLIGFAYKNVFTYYLGTTTAQGKKDQAMVWLITEAMQFAQQLECKLFDFEGSMIEPIEKFFRGFGASYKPYYTIRKKLSFSK